MKAVILTEAGRKPGYGHLARCESIRQALRRRGFSAVLAVRGSLPSPGRLADGSGTLFFDWIRSRKRLLRLLRTADAVVVDSYLAGPELYAAVFGAVPACLYLDDFKRLRYPAGIVVNSAVGAENLRYPRSKELTLLLGSRYSPLRKEFVSVPAKRIRPRVRSVLLSFGGTEGVSLARTLALRLQRRFGCSCRVVDPARPVSAAGMRRLMMGADVCVSACGQTTYELARCGVPTIGVGVAENQRLNIKGWKAAGFLFFAGWREDRVLPEKVERIMLDLDLRRRRKASRIGRAMVDGKGAERIADALLAKVRRK